jgi:hypothetical protein
VVKNPEYAVFADVLCARARRIAAWDIDSLVLVAELADAIDASIREAVTGCEPAATAGPRSASTSALLARPPSSGGAIGRDFMSGQGKISVPVACPIGQ